MSHVMASSPKNMKVYDIVISALTLKKLQDSKMF